LAAGWGFGEGQEDAGLAIRRLDGLILVLDVPGDGPDRTTGLADRLAAIFCTVRTAARRMDDGGAIVLVAPDDEHDAGRSEPQSGALETLVRSLAIALGSAGISVNLIRVRSVAPASRRWDPADGLAGPVTYLLARDTSYLTGQVLHVDPPLDLSR
jgi:NAD(P)-dependent dehydrogenase (short-subunit alcohol dehydrogenase family)